MSLNFNAKAREAVPEDTIKAFWNIYRDSNWGREFGTLKNGNRYLGDIDGISKFNSEYKWKPRDCNRFGRHCEDKSIYSSGKVPIGTWATVYNKNCTEGKIMDDIYWGGGNYSGTEFPQRLPEDVATNCAGGSEFTHDFVDRENNYPTLTKSRPFNQFDGGKTDKCFIGNKHTNRQDLEDCIISGVHYPSFCQLGDYIETQKECRDQCKGTRSLDGTSTYCHFAKDRLCGKQIGDPLKKNALNVVIDSDKNWIREGICTDYCGGPGEVSSGLCKSHKRNYCTNKDNWPDAEDYCYNYWKSNFNTSEMNNTCKTKLETASSPENITTGIGCGKLCRGRGLDINEPYCDSRRLGYCTANENNMETNYCFNFCKDNPDLCEPYLNTYCKDKGDKLDLPAGIDGKKYSDYCGCFMGTDFYDKYKDEIFKQFEQGGYKIQGVANIRSEPECIFPQCKSGSILTSDQRKNIPNCGTSCVQIMLNNFENANVTGNYLADQSAECTNITKEVMPTSEPSVTEPPVTEPPFTEEPDDDTSIPPPPLHDETESQLSGQQQQQPPQTEGEEETKDDNLPAIIGGSLAALVIVIGLLFGLGIYIQSKLKIPQRNK